MKLVNFAWRVEMFGLNDDDKTHAEPRGSGPQDDNLNVFHHPSISDDDLGAARPHPQLQVPEEDLLHLKTQALQSLAPLVGHLEQTPEEKFKTTMMMIQASDNPELIREAYQAANRIEDEKARAQALLDVINEINYFTQKGKS